MKNTLKHFTHLMVLAALVFGITAPRAASAQDYKEKFNSALEAAKAKNMQQAYTLFGEAAQLASAADDAEIATKSRSTMAKIDYLLGRQAINGENFEAAVTRFDQGIEIDPSYANNYVGKALALKKLDRVDDAIQAYASLIELGNETNDREAVRLGEGGLRDHFVYLASTALSRNGENTSRRDADEALGHLAELEQYVDVSEDADVLFYKAAAHTARSEYAEAVELANKALEVHRGSRTDAAKIYFVLGEAHMYAGNATAAKDAFRNATFGSYKAPAEHYLETL